MDKNIDIEAALAEFEAAERAKLGLDAGPKAQWSDKMIDPFFGKSERAKVTLLFGGLTMAHDFLIEGALRGLNYRTRALDCPDNDALRLGKEFGNRGQCNPTYFTVGNLVKELTRLRDEEGLSTREVIDGYIFLTASACGPCRFGMYVTEYRKALRDAGFDGFRVLLFQQTGGLKQATGEELGLVLDPPFFLALIKSMLTGDVLNALGYRIRPYEVEPGATDRAITQAKADIYAALMERRSVLRALYLARKHLDAVKVDRLRSKPKASIIGEFWAMTTEGDGNYHLQRFLEQEGAECEIQLLANLLLYNLWEYRNDTADRATLRGEDEAHYGLAGMDAGQRLAGLWAGQLLLRTAFQTFAHVAGLRGYRLTDMDEAAEAAEGFYDTDLRGGEGHTEVAKLILNVKKKKTHMTVSVKPFGCMPSSGVSDGVQSKVTEKFPEAIFCAVETNGDGAVNFYSRVQMYLFKARQRAQEELDQVLREEGVTLEQVREYVDAHGYDRGLAHVPHRATGTGADLVRHVAPFIGKTPIERAKVRLDRAIARTRKLVQEDLPWIADKTRVIAPHGLSLVRLAVTEGQTMLPSAKELWNSFVGSLVKPSEEEVASVGRADREQIAASIPKETARALPVVA